jgi:hypothetical protein
LNGFYSFAAKRRVELIAGAERARSDFAARQSFSSSFDSEGSCASLSHSSAQSFSLAHPGAHGSQLRGDDLLSPLPGRPARPHHGRSDSARYPRRMRPAAPYAPATGAELFQLSSRRARERFGGPPVLGQEFRATRCRRVLPQQRHVPQASRSPGVHPRRAESATPELTALEEAPA